MGLTKQYNRMYGFKFCFSFALSSTSSEQLFDQRKIEFTQSATVCSSQRILAGGQHV